MYYFIGIKGTGMSALAVILKQLGYEVSGSDVGEHFFTEDGLVENNIPFYVYNKNNIKEGYTIIKGASIKETNEELIRARELNLEIIEYYEMLSKLSNEYKTIGVCGCHGKTTTTNFMALALKSIGTNYLIGDGSGHASKENEYFVLESCEYRRHFLYYNPYYVVILNIDLDHVDYYKDIDDVASAYLEFAKKAKKGLILNGDDKYCRALNLDIDTIYFGLNKNNDIRPINLEYTKDGMCFDIENYGHFELPIYGDGQLYSVLATITLCIKENIKYEDIIKNLKEFKGAKRRMTETIVGNSVIVDDYAHHPNEVKITLKAMKQKYPDKELIAIFKPHTFSRTKEFGEEIATNLNIANKQFILDIYPARETQEEYPNITSNIIIEKTTNGNHLNMDEAYKLVNDNDSTVYIFMSPSDLYTLENDLINILKNK